MEDSIPGLDCDTEVVVICKRCLIAGRVQGVFYRASAAHRARELGVRGYARNLADGRVEVLACGDAAALEQFVEWLWIGPSAAKVQAVEATEVACDPGAVPHGFLTA
jgi:acylphosphatase